MNFVKQTCFGFDKDLWQQFSHGSLRDVTASALQAVSRVDSIKKVVNRLEPCGTRREGNECHREGSETAAAFGGEQQGRLDGFACRA